jgi:type III secretion protein HrpB1
MSSFSSDEESIPELMDKLSLALQAHSLYEATDLLDTLCRLNPELKEMRLFPVFIEIQRGNVFGALQILNEGNENENPELRAICLRLLGDPMWHFYAMKAMETGDESVREGMRILLSS